MEKRITFFQALRAMNQDDPRKALKVARAYFAQTTRPSESQGNPDIPL